MRIIPVWLRPAVVAPAIAIVYVVLVAAAAGDPFVIVTLGAKFAPADLQPHHYSPSGYDGQFAYYLARYGLDAAPYLDVPAYRAQRILLPLLGRLVSLGQPSLLIPALVGVNVCALAAGTYWLERLLAARQAGRWPALGVALSLGMLGAVRMTTTEPLAYGLAIGGVYFADRARWLPAAAAFGLAALAKETTLLMAIACAVYAIVRRDGRAAAIVSAGAWAPFAAWQWLLFDRYGAIGVGSGGANTTGFEAVPFLGFVRPVAQSARASQIEIAVVLAVLMALFVVVPAIWSLWRLAVPRRAFADWRLADWVLAANVAVIPFVPASTFAEPLGMFRLLVGLQIGVTLFAAEYSRRTALVNTTFWALTTLLPIVIDLRHVAAR